MVPIQADLPRSGLSPREALARYYDLDLLDVGDDVEMYLALAGRGAGAVLELAAGSGRVAIPLALAGHRVVAVDDDEAMLERARLAWQRAFPRDEAATGSLQLLDADLTAFRSDERFGLAILAQNSLLLMPDEEARLAALRTLRLHLRPGGLAVVDIVVPRAEETATWDGRLQLEWLRRDPESGDQVAKLISAVHHPEASSVTLTQLFDATPAEGGPVRRISRVDTLHLLDVRELRRLASRVGFGDVRIRGDHRLRPHGAGSHRAILLAREV